MNNNFYFAITQQDWLFIDSSSDESTSDSDSSDEDREGPPQKRTCVKRFVEDTVNIYSDLEFKNHFRLSRQTAYNLIERFQQSIFLANNEPQANAITHERALLMTLCDSEDEDNSENDDANERRNVENENEILNFGDRRMIVFDEMFGENIHN
ncbi:hypothetical protein EVAR_31274_1 [Eumeta japonica]|uniref:Uncharacterized protein n=1 Tax=Eumeta variegata TaxID=151549 RepID=A0A4C1VSH4_EUMVA|nr:hypothetical protein EVAR_31274_1 [Eumeta japonica]